jgi:hypothetical protein
MLINILESGWGFHLGRSRQVIDPLPFFGKHTLNPKKFLLALIFCMVLILLMTWKGIESHIVFIATLEFWFILILIKMIHGMHMDAREKRCSNTKTTHKFQSTLPDQ